MEPTTPKKPFQFSLRMLFAVTLFVACLLGITRLFPDQTFVWAVSIEVLTIAIFVNILVIAALERSRKRHPPSKTLPPDESPAGRSMHNEG